MSKKFTSTCTKINEKKFDKNVIFDYMYICVYVYNFNFESSNVYVTI